MSATVTDTKPPHRAKLAIVLLGILAGVQGVDPNVAATALPEASKALGMEGDLQALAASISTLFLAASVVTTGLLADRLGRRKVLMAALVVSIVGDLLVAVSPEAVVYLAGRAIAGVGLGAVYGAAFAYIRAVTKPKDLPAAIGVFTAVLMAYTVAFTFIGGALSGIDWRLAFVVTPAASALCLLAVPAILPKEPVVATGKADLPGQLALIVALVGVLYGINNISGGLGDPLFFAPLLVGAVAGVLFVVRESRSPHAFFPIALFKSPIFLAAIMAGLVYNMGNGVAFLQMSNLWHYITRIDSLDVSLWQLPFLLLGVVAGLVFGRLMKHGLTNRATLLIGTVLTSAGFVLLTLVTSTSSFWAFMGPSGLIGFGIVVASMPFANLIMQAAPPRYFGPVTSARTTIGQVWYTVGVALSTLLIDRITRGGVTQRLTDAGVPPTQLGTALDHVRVYATETHTDVSKKGAEALEGVRDSYLTAMNTTMLVFAGVILFAGLLGVALLTRTKGDPPPAGGPHSASDDAMGTTPPTGGTSAPTAAPAAAAAATTTVTTTGQGDTPEPASNPPPTTT